MTLTCSCVTPCRICAFKRGTSRENRRLRRTLPGKPLFAPNIGWESKLHTCCWYVYVFT